MEPDCGFWEVHEEGVGVVESGCGVGVAVWARRACN